jgi:hypothetical protein
MPLKRRFWIKIHACSMDPFLLSQILHEYVQDDTATADMKMLYQAAKSGPPEGGTPNNDALR